MMKLFYQRAPFKIATYALIALSVLREWKTGYFKRFGDYLKTVRIFFYLKGLAAAAVLTAVVMVTADPWLSELGSRHAPFMQELSEISGLLGKSNGPWLLMTAGYWLAAAFKKNRVRTAAFGCLLSSALTAGIVTLFKYAFMRARPDQALGHFSFFNFDHLTRHANDFLSFSSGDVAVVAGASAYLFYHVKNPFLRALFVILPVLNAFARVHGLRHWPSDGLFSILIGFMAALFIYRYACYVNPQPESVKESS